MFGSLSQKRKEKSDALREKKKHKNGDLEKKEGGGGHTKRGINMLYGTSGIRHLRRCDI